MPHDARLTLRTWTISAPAAISDPRGRRRAFKKTLETARGLPRSPLTRVRIEPANDAPSGYVVRYTTDHPLPGAEVGERVEVGSTVFRLLSRG
ncbi:MAG: hypothetical protein H6739_12140 [Alphaproteobacteria bacterium]|nr:hypothetical protein [Alphaproteobacteria bacterium]